MTTIIGRNRRGKSATLRALRFVTLNQPSGSSFINWSADFTKAVLYFDGHKLVRKKGKGCNLYVLDGKKYKAFGNDVPDPIRDLLNVGQVNFQMQTDPVFWFNLSPGQVSKELNQIINLDVIDSSFANIAQKARASSSEYNVTKKRLEEARAARDFYSWATDAGIALSRIEKLDERVTDLSDKHSRLITNLEKIQSLEKTMRASGRVIRAVKSAARLAQSADNLSAKIGTVQDKINKVAKLLSSVSNLAGQVCQLKQEIPSLEKQLHQSLKGKPCPVCGAVVR